MNLLEKDVDRFFRLYHGLLFYVNKKYNTIKSLKKPEDIFGAPFSDIVELKEKLYADPDIMDAFIKENPPRFSSQDLDIIRSWKNFVKGKFMIMSYKKDYTVFLELTDPPKAYGVLGLNSSFQEMLGPNLPVSVELTLLPYGDKITYDGTLLSDRVIFGPHMRRDFKLLLDQAQGLYGIITQLPFKPEKPEPTDLEKLKIYLKTKDSRDAYYSEIQNLISKDPELMVYYSQAMGKVEARILKRKLKDAGVTRGWFAILDNMIIAGGRSKGEVESILGEMLDEAKRKHVYIFDLK
jgi:hypothetical protein